MTASPQPGNQDERRCVCGDTLGQHDVDGDRQCLAGDPDNPWECDCSEFRAAADAGQTGAGEDVDDPWSEARESVLCACGSPGSRHAGVRGLPLDGCLDSPCPCTKFEPAPSAGQDTGQMRDELIELQRAWAVNRATDRPAFADALLDGPLRQLIAERDDLRRELDQARGQVQRVREFADELAEDSRTAKRLADEARARGDREMQRINMRHARVAHHAAEELRRALDPT